VRFTGSGPGARSKDGCSVELYKRVPYQGELDFLPGFLPAGSAVLELGCGAGRLTRPMLAMGLRVTAVDNSSDMLANLPSETAQVCCDIEALELNERFDAVLLASNLINVPGDQTRDLFLRVCKMHLRPAGQLFFERHAPSWLHSIKHGAAGKIGEIEIVVEDFQRNDKELYVKLAYAVGQDVWTQEFFTRILNDDEITAILQAHGFTVPDWLDKRQRWGRCIVASPATK
jgi:SAM-dependent methyltransferase